MRLPRRCLFLNLTLWLYTLVPGALLAALYSFVVRARIELGRWPAPMQPDPKSLSVARDAHMEIVVWLAIGSLCCFLPWLWTACVRQQVVAGQRWHHTALQAIPWLMVAGVYFLDPGNYVEWFLD